jgi:hypothetical protein
MVLTQEGAREIRGIVVAIVVAIAPSFFDWVPLAAKIALPLVGLAIFLWTFCPQKIRGVSMTFGMVLVAVSVVGLAAGGILHFAAPGLLGSPAVAEPAKPIPGGPSGNSGSQNAGGNITNTGPVYMAPVTIVPPPSNPPPKKRAPKKSAEKEGGSVIGSMKDSTFIKQRGNNGTINLEGAIACGFNTGLDQSGAGNAFNSKNVKVLKDCPEGGAALYIERMNTYPKQQPPAANRPQNCLNDLNGSTVGTAEINHNTILTNEPLSLYCNRDGSTDHLSEDGNFVLPLNPAPTPPQTPAPPANPN